MQVSELTIRLIILLIPGLIAAMIVDSLTIHRKWSSVQFIVHSILLGFFSYVFYQLFVYLFGLLKWLLFGVYNQWLITFWSSIFDKSVPISLPEVIWTCFVSVLLGLFVTWSIHCKWLYRCAKKMAFTDVYGEEELYTNFVRSDDIGWVWLRYRPFDLTYEGFIKSFSEDEKIQEIELSDVKVYSTEDGTFQYELSRVYLAAPRGEFVIEIPREEKDKWNEGKNS